MITLYTANTPNGVKVTIAMAEMGFEPHKDYTLKILDLKNGEQKSPEFLKINPNGRIPALLDNSPKSEKPLRVFESGAALLYLAERFGKLLPADPAGRMEAISWTYFQTGGIGPAIGQAGYFKNNQPDNTLAITRFMDESQRLVGVMEDVLSQRKYLAGDEFSIADIMHIGWIDRAPNYMGLDLSKFPAVAKWHSRMMARPGVQSGMAVLKP